MRYAKFAIAALAAGLTAVAAAITDGSISPQEWVAIVLAAVGALGVYLVPNSPVEPLD